MKDSPHEPDDEAGTEPPAAPGDAPSEESTRGGLSDLFGRGMIYVLIWSLQLIVATFVSPVLTHSLPPAEFGSLSAAIALYQALIVVAVFGLDQALELLRVEEKTPGAPVSRGLLAGAILMAWAFVALVGVASPWWGPMLGFDDGSPLVLIVLFWTAPAAAVLMMLALLQAEDRLGPFALVGIFATAGGLVFGLILLFSVERTATAYVFGSVVAQVIALLLGIWLIRPRWKGMWQPAAFRAAFALGIPLVMAGLAHFVLTAADRFLIQRWLGPVDVARYQVAFTVGNAISLLLMFTNRAWLPRLKTIVSADERWEAVVRARDGVYRLLAWALLGITVSAPVLLWVFAPASYDLAPLTPVVFVVALGALPLNSIAASTQILLTEATSRPLLLAAVTAVVVKVVVTLIGLTWWGLIGAALGTLLAVLAEALVLKWIVSLRHRSIRGSLGTPVLLAATLIVAGVSIVLPQEGSWFWGRFVFSAVCLIPFILAWRQLQAGQQGHAEAP